jgi:hypothetical protein
MEAIKHTVSPLAQKTWTAWLLSTPKPDRVSGGGPVAAPAHDLFSFTDAMLTLPGD